MRASMIRYNKFRKFKYGLPTKPRNFVTSKKPSQIVAVITKSKFAEKEL
jgi:hypothetical protein